ncbi:MAG: thioesterase [Alphaproteobacteria bacterium]|nr:thioesterase [Alphaproteobacteria bacterium]MCL2758379.1 thioesterase [Alphaproteobacteria bacterium]
MQKYIVKKTLRTYKMDRHGLLRPVMLMNELQGVADSHAEVLGRGRTYCVDTGRAWVVTHYLVDIVQMPGENQEIEIYTWPSAADALRAARDFEIKDAATGDVMVRATSQWVMIDINTRRPVRIDEVLADWGTLDERVIDRPFEKFPEFEPALTWVAHPRFDDLDLNQHINNAVYATWAAESLGFEFRDGHKLYRLDINFKKEIPAGVRTIDVESRIDGMVSRHMIKNEVEHANVICEWEKI